MDKIKTGADTLKNLLDAYDNCSKKSYSQLLQEYRDWKRATHNSDRITVTEMEALKKHAKKKEVFHPVSITSFYRRIWNEV